MTRRGVRIFRRIAAMSAVLAAAGLALAAPAASAATSGTQGDGGSSGEVVYAALGDSYSSGVGSTADPNPNVPDCYRTPDAWPSQVGAALGWTTVNLACSGAQTKDIVAPYGGQPAQTDLLAALQPRPQVVSITIGGNDVGFSRVLGACYVSDCTDDVARADQTAVTTLPGQLASTYRAVEAADPDARLVVVGYPRLFPRDPAAVTGCPWLSEAERRSLVDGGALLNAVIAVQAWLAGATFIDVSNTLDGHELCTADSWFVPLTEPMGAHPNDAGQKAIAAAVTRRLADLPVTPPLTEGTR
jgi:lysophospholipase L1-like esterase